MNWQAIGIGVAISVLAWFGIYALGTLTVHESAETAMALWRWLGPLLSSAGDIAAGGAAGWIAGRSGGAHGAIAVALGSVATLVGGTVLAIVRMGGELNYLTEPSYWLGVIGWSLFGIVLGAVAGLVAVKIRGRAATT